MNAPMPEPGDAWAVSDSRAEAGYTTPGSAGIDIESRVAKVIADKVYEDAYGADNTEFAGERMDLCDEQAVEILDRLKARGMVIVYLPSMDEHRDEVAS